MTTLAPEAARIATHMVEFDCGENKPSESTVGEFQRRPYVLSTKVEGAEEGRRSNVLSVAVDVETWLAFQPELGVDIERNEDDGAIILTRGLRRLLEASVAGRTLPRRDATLQQDPAGTPYHQVLNVERPEEDEVPELV